MGEHVENMLARDAQEHGCTHPMLGGEIILYIDQLVKGDRNGISAAARTHLDRCSACQAAVVDARRAFAEAKPELDAIIRHRGGRRST